MEAALRHKISRLQKRIDVLEGIIEDRSREVFLINEQLQASSAFLQELYRTMPSALLIIDDFGTVNSANTAAAQLLGYESPEGLNGKQIAAVFARGDDLQTAERTRRRVETSLLTLDGRDVPVLLSVAPVVRGSNGPVRVCMALDLRERQQLEIELRHAQKLESVGRLAAGIAHEINTPTQFVSDSIHFVREAIDDLLRLFESYQALRGWAESKAEAAELVQNVDDVADEIDVEYINDNLPKSLDRALDGLGRIATIVRSMKEFAHPDLREMTTVNLNQAIESTLTIARNEYKYVADLETSFGDIPLVTCHAGDVNQAVLNVVVNAAHAIADSVKGTTLKGHIKVWTQRDGDHVVIAVRDSGNGIPEGVRDRIFDPFFTTKEVGRGTGQGLSITRAVVVDKHGGSIHFETKVGGGTTFFIRLPVDGKPHRRQEAAA